MTLIPLVTLSACLPRYTDFFAIICNRLWCFVDTNEAETLKQRTHQYNIIQDTMTNNITDDTSVGRDSVFDWGGKDGTNNVRMSSIIPSTSRTNNSSNSNRSNNSGGDDSEPSSRYDPTAMSRIVDITDLVDDEDDSSDDEAPVGRKSSMPRNHIGTMDLTGRHNNTGGGVSNKRGLLFLSIVMILSVMGLSLVVYGSSSPKIHSEYLLVNEDEEQSKLELAERVVTACSDGSLSNECKTLCHSKTCCFEEGEYGCQSDASKECIVYAGCEALVNGKLLDGADEDEA